MNLKKRSTANIALLTVYFVMQCAAREWSMTKRWSYFSYVLSFSKTTLPVLNHGGGEAMHRAPSWRILVQALQMRKGEIAYLGCSYHTQQEWEYLENATWDSLLAIGFDILVEQPDKAVSHENKHSTPSKVSRHDKMVIIPAICVFWNLVLCTKSTNFEELFFYYAVIFISAPKLDSDGWCLTILVDVAGHPQCQSLL